jgi:predicted O-methyltransferase YrrM
MILNKPMLDYLQQLIPPRTGMIHDIEQEGMKHNVPIIQSAGAQVLQSITALRRPKAILEIGTAIGYSAILMAQAATNAHITTLEIDPERVKQAEANIHKCKLSERIKVIAGDAVESIPRLNQQFDMVFIDAAKGKYELFFELVFPKVTLEGMLVIDNVLFRGMVTLEDEQVDRKYRSMVRKLKQFNTMLSVHPQLETCFLPVGDGLAVSRKLSEATQNE